MARAWLVVGLLWFAGALNYLDRNMVATMRVSLKEAIPMTDAQFGLLTSIFLWVYGLLSPFAGFLADRFSRSKVIVGSLLVWSTMTWLTGHAKNFEQLVTVRALMGISEACYIPAALALIADYHRANTRSLATGVHLSGIMVGAALGGVGGWLAEKYEWTYAFRLFGFIGAAYAMVLMLVLRDPPNERVPGEKPAPLEQIRLTTALATLFSQGTFWLLLGFWGLLGLVGWAVVGWLPTYLQEHFKLTQGEAGISATGYVQLAAFVGVLLGGYLADRWGSRNERGRIMVPVIALLIAAPGIWLASTTHVLGFAIVGLIVYGLTRSFSDTNLMPIVCLVVDKRYRATAYGTLNLFACIVGGVTVYVGGAIMDAHVDSSRIFQVAALSLVVCAGILFMVKPAPAVSNAKGTVLGSPDTDESRSAERMADPIWPAEDTGPKHKPIL